MGLLTGAANIYFTYKFLRLLTMKWENTDAFKLGIIDKDGVPLKKVADLNSTEERDAYSLFNRLIYNLKRILNKMPFGKTSIASYAAALFLIKEQSDMSEDDIMIILEKAGYEFNHTPLDENKQYFILENEVLAPGEYTLTNELVSNKTGLVAGKIGTTVIAEGARPPVGEFLGHYIYSVKHKATNLELFVSARDLKK